MYKEKVGILLVLWCVLHSGCQTIHSWKTACGALKGEPVMTATQLLGEPVAVYPLKRGTAYLWAEPGANFSSDDHIPGMLKNSESYVMLRANDQGIISDWRVRQAEGELLAIQRKLSSFADQQRIEPTPRRLRNWQSRDPDWDWLDVNPVMPVSDGSSRWDGRAGP